MLTQTPGGGFIYAVFLRGGPSTATAPGLKAGFSTSWKQAGQAVTKPRLDLLDDDGGPRSLYRARAANRAAWRVFGLQDIRGR